MGAVSRIAIIVPCHNEHERLNLDEFATLLGDPSVTLVFVDDGSSDGTGELIEAAAAGRPDRIALVTLAENAGKGEAVRQGMLAALERGCDIAGYVDADLATPVEEIRRLAEAAEARDCDAVLGSRIAHLGADIERSAARHYLGRVFATAASVALGIRVYDTQCGAKFFRASPELRRALAEPFQSRWAFDVELLGRLVGQGQRIIEVPLQRWRDVEGSKLRLRSMVRAGVDVVRIAARRRRDKVSG